MAAKTIMKRIAIAALSAVILQGVTPLDSLNVYASENTGASYTALDLYTYIQDQCSTEYTLTEKAETFLEEHDDFFPASPELVIPDEMIDAELDFRHINKNPSRYGDKLMRISDAYVIQVQEEEMEEGGEAPAPKPEAKKPEPKKPAEKKPAPKKNGDKE